MSHFEISIEDNLEQIHPNGICYGCTFSTLKQLTKTVYVEDGEDEAKRFTDLNIVYYEVVKIVLIHRISIHVPPPWKGLFF